MKATNMPSMNKKGFTLVEVVASVVIVGIAIVSVLGMYSIGNKAARLNMQKLYMYNVLQYHIEEQLSKDFPERIIFAKPSDIHSPVAYEITVRNPRPGGIRSNKYPHKTITVSVKWWEDDARTIMHKEEIKVIQGDFN